LPFEPLDPAILNGDMFLERAAAHGYLSSKLAFLDHQFGHNWFPPLSTSVRRSDSVLLGSSDPQLPKRVLRNWIQPRVTLGTKGLAASACE
jgi:hypothetical protein